MKYLSAAVNINAFKVSMRHVSSYENAKLLDTKQFKSNSVLKYDKDKLCFNFVSSRFAWKLTETTVMFKKQQIDQQCIEINKPTNEFDIDEQATISVNIKNIFLDLFSKTNDRTFTVVVAYLKDATDKCISTFEFSLPVVKDQIKCPRYRLMTVDPDETTRQICKQNFIMTKSNSEKEKEKCILLEQFKKTDPKDRLRNFGYCTMLTNMLLIEDSFIMDLVEASNLNNHLIQQVSKITYKIKTNGKVPECAEAVRFNPINLVEYSNDMIFVMNFRIIKHANDHVIIEIPAMEISTSTPYDIRFIPSLFNNKMAHMALETFKENRLEKWLLDFNGVENVPSEHVKVHQDFKWFNENISTNDEQKLAVKNVVNQTSKDMPFIIFGPPGTGKTSTLVEAVAQIVTLNPKSRILISANSNSACDEIGERLIKILSVNKVFRFYAPSFEGRMEKINPKLKEISNVRNGKNAFPTYQEFYSYNVVISTLVNCGRLKLAGIDSEHFNYLFIDECASVAECYAAIPIAVCSELDRITASLVFCGDHKQLGPILNTHHNERFGFSVSLMERVLLQDQYKRNPNYNTNIAIKLVNNFRSHRSILKYSSVQFYNGELKACQSKDIANFAIGWGLLPNKKFPVLFHSVFAASELVGTSTYNSTELNQTKLYVDILLKYGINGKKVSPMDIGIICPYNAQRSKLKQLFGNDIEIGTVEYYQGREKKIIIFSAVRSETPTLGFIRNEKRLNVALTRAKSLMIVIGNPKTLCRNHYWREFIRYCSINNAIVGWAPEQKQGCCVDDNKAITLEEMLDGMSITE